MLMGLAVPVRVLWHATLPHLGHVLRSQPASHLLRLQEPSEFLKSLLDMQQLVPAFHERGLHESNSRVVERVQPLLGT